MLFPCARIDRADQVGHPARSSWRSMYVRMPSSSFVQMNGSTKLAVPTCTAVAPAMMNSSASVHVAMPPMPMIGNLHRAPAFVHHAHGNRPDGRAAQSADDVRQLRPSGLDVDGHGQERVDERHRIGAGILGRFGNRGDVGDVRRQLRDHRQARHLLARR